MRRQIGNLASGLLAVVVVGMVVVGAADGTVDPTGGTVACSDGVTELTGTASPEQEKTYELLAFEVPAGTERIEVGYEWTPTEGGVIDLGVWDASGTSGPDAFRTWAGSRQGRLDEGTAPLVIAPDRNERTVVADTIDAGTWHVELGYAAVEEPLAWTVQIRCVAGPAAEPLAPDPVDPLRVARDEPGWYAGDFHLHGYHSNPEGPEPQEMVDMAEDAGLDIIPVTEYVTPAHWDRLGRVQRDNPEVLVWPGREVITYFGHMVVLSETSSIVEHRVGFEGITAADIQRASASDGALVSLAHPTIFPPETFGSMCRGCFFEMLDETDFEAVQLIEVVTESAVAEFDGQVVPNPFVRTAVELWEGLLRKGHRLTAVSGSDDKLGDGYGSTSTMVHAEQLSRPAVDEALRRGHAYVRGLGAESPEMELEAVDDDSGETAMFGDTLAADTAEITITVHDGDGQELAIRRNGLEVQRVTVTGDEFTHTVRASRSADEGPLGTFWGAELLELRRFPGTEVPTVIANPVFLADQPAATPALPEFAPLSATVDSGPGIVGEQSPDDSRTLQWILLAVALLVAGVLVAVWRRVRTRASGR